MQDQVCGMQVLSTILAKAAEGPRVLPWWDLELW